MKVFTFIADSAPEAVAQIRAQLGPDAVVLNVRKLEADGLGKLWKKPRIEVQAHLPEAEPEPPAAAAPPALENSTVAALGDLRRELAELRRQIPGSAPVDAPAARVSNLNYEGWRVGAFLEKAGVLPRQALRIVDQLQVEHGPKPPSDFSGELEMTRALLLRSQPALPRSKDVEILIGPPGTGKTTVLSKLLARAALVESRPVRVWRLDGATANTAESLSVYAEILGAAVERCFTGGPFAQSGELALVDFPGVPADDGAAISALRNRLAEFPGARIHLTLNAAYDATILQKQIRAFSALPISGLVFTHLDEETRWGKLLNFAFGTNYSIGYLSAGQNVPGELHEHGLEKIVACVIPSK